MAPLPSAQHHKSETEKAFHVHLTGFGPFRKVLNNPSWLAVSPLHQTTLLNPPSPLRPAALSWTAYAWSFVDWFLCLPALRPTVALFAPTPKPTRAIYLTSSLVPVTYKDVLEIVPILHSPKEGSTPDLIVHVGVGRDGRLTLEQRGRRWGYKGLDADGKLCEAEEGGEARQGFVDGKWAKVVQMGEGEEGGAEIEEVRTMIDPDNVLDFIKGNGLEHIIKSEDAGLYLCEFITFCSTATARIAANNKKQHETPVQFIHIPSIGAPYSLDELTQAIKLIVWGIVNES